MDETSFKGVDWCDLIFLKVVGLGVLVRDGLA